MKVRSKTFFKEIFVKDRARDRRNTSIIAVLTIIVLVSGVAYLGGLRAIAFGNTVEAKSTAKPLSVTSVYQSNNSADATFPQPGVISIKFPELLIVTRYEGKGNFRVHKHLDLDPSYTVDVGSSGDFTSMRPLTERWQLVNGGYMVASHEVGAVIRVTKGGQQVSCIVQVSRLPKSAGIIGHCG